jgi:manganese/zinc/iron transport system permease protein
VKSLNSPLLLAGAALTGVLTVTLTEMVIKTRKLKEDAAIGLVFPVLFSMGVLLISRYTSRVHLDSDCVLFGEIALTPFNRFVFAGHDLGPVALWTMGAILCVNIFFIVLFYKELKVSTFDPGLAAAFGFAPVLLHYALMTLVSVTCVGAFESVGSILVVALMITPAATAYLITDRLSRMIFYSVGFGVLSAVGGYFLAIRLDASIAGCMAFMSGVLFLLVFLFSPERGLLAKILFKRWNRWDFALQTLAVHLWQAESGTAQKTESIVSHMYNHMLWDEQMTSEVIAQGLKEGIIRKESDLLSLTPYGREKARLIMVRS